MITHLLLSSRLRHWDVNNEMMHGDFFEQRAKDPYYTEKVINMAYQADPSALYFYNDFKVVANEGDILYVSKIRL